MTTANKPAMQRHTVFLVQIMWLVMLGVLAGLYFYTNVFDDRPLGPIPLGVIWFGALGAVLISLNGIIDHAHDWDPSFDLWHLSRPVMGAALAVVGVLIVQAGVLAVGREPNNGNIPQNLLYYLVAFLIGYREETFRELLKRLVDLIFAPATSKPAPSIAKLEPSSAPKAGKTPVVITGAGLSGATSIIFGSHAAEFHVDSDNRVTAELPETDAAGPVAVVVKTSAGAASHTFDYAA